MRFMCRFRIPVAVGNRLAQEGKLGLKLQAILEEQKPEAVYFSMDQGKRTAFVVLNIDNPSQIPAIAEPWFHAVEAEMDADPAMTPEDLKNAGPDIEAAVKKYA
ncbi:MAG: hypothetical protein GF341_10210 [candidate division Zixibacteria bacterium]|nr:hypothetical protein [candidate division Zixibacteria bacterium]